MKSVEKPLSLTTSEIWKTELKENFSDLTSSTSLFDLPGLVFIAGCEDGMVRVYKPAHGGMGLDLKPQLELETKSGPIQCLAVHDITRCYKSDLIVGDSCGVLTMFCNKNILSRQSLSADKDSITCVTVIQDNDNIPVAVCASSSGVITAVRPNTLMWRLDLNSSNIPINNKRVVSSAVRVLCLTGYRMTDGCGNRRLYLLVADDAKRIHIISKGIIVKSVPTPININAMTQGRIVSAHKLENTVSGEENSEREQVALGGSNGAVLILDKFDVTDECINAQSPITRLKCIPQQDSSTDLLLCAGHFNSLQIFKDGNPLLVFDTSAWVMSIDTVDVDKDGDDEIVISCMDNTVMALKLTFSESLS